MKFIHIFGASILTPMVSSVQAVTRMCFVLRNAALIGLFALALTSQTQAAPTGGPYIDFKGYLGTDIVGGGPGMVTTTILWRMNHDTPPYVTYTASPIPGSYRVAIADGALGLGNSPDSPLRVVGVSYVTPSDVLNGPSRFTTIYGVDSNPTDPNSLAMTGYNFAAPQVTVSGEHVIGADGINYYPDAALPQGLVRISDLANSNYLGSSADLSPFQGAVDQSAAVWLFQTFIPDSALTVPLPSAVWGALGLAPLILVRRRCRL